MKKCIAPVILLAMIIALQSSISIASQEILEIETSTTLYIDKALGSKFATEYLYKK